MNNNYNKKNKKELIKEEAKKILSEKSYAEMNINDLTTLCDISKRTFYHYYSSKEELYSIIVNEIIENDYLKLSLLNFNNDNKNNLLLIIKYFIEKNIDDTIIMKKEFLNGFNIINKKNIEVFKKINILIKNNLKYNNINYSFLIVTIINLCESFLVLKRNKLSTKTMFLENFDNDLKEIENKNFIINNINAMILSYLEIKQYNIIE